MSIQHFAEPYKVYIPESMMFYSAVFHFCTIANHGERLPPHHRVAVDGAATYGMAALNMRKVSANLTSPNFTFFCVHFVVPGFCVK